MRYWIIICTLFLSAATKSYATVYEFGVDGSVTTHETADYRYREDYQEEIEVKPLPDDSKFNVYIKKAAQKYKINPALIHAVILTESAYDPYAISSAGAEGLMQLMPETAKIYRVSDSFDPEQNIMAGTRHLQHLLKRYNNDTDLILAAYNAGENAVEKYNGIPPYPETESYIIKVRSIMGADYKNPQFIAEKHGISTIWGKFSTHLLLFYKKVLAN